MSTKSEKNTKCKYCSQLYTEHGLKVHINKCPVKKENELKVLQDYITLEKKRKKNFIIERLNTFDDQHLINVNIFESINKLIKKNNVLKELLDKQNREIENLKDLLDKQDRAIVYLNDKF